ncbi:MAG: sulfatase-like hydrolase/transferase [Christensenellales bacterium]|jgi:arylsulfatase A-like enzyme
MSKQNLLILMADQFRHDCAGYRGMRAVKTPNIDRLANAGAVYTRAYTPLPVCAPIRQSLVNGLHPNSFGAQWNYDFFMTPTAAPTGMTWIEQLRVRGYRGAYVGKWHISPKYGAKDFGYTDVVPLGEHQAFQKQKYPDAAFEGGWLGCTSPIPVEDSLTHYMADRACDLLEEYAQTGENWHMWFDLGVPHLPCRPSEPFASMYDPKSIAPWDGFGDEFVDKPYCQRQQMLNWRQEEMTWADYQPMVARYFAMISQFDDALGRILGALERTGQAENTIVVFTSDHGDMCGSHQMLDKHYVLFEDNTRIPLCVKAPGRAPYQTDSFVSGSIDIAYTIHDLMGLEMPDGLHGRRLPLSQAENVSPRGYITSSSNGQQFGLYTNRMIRGERYKYIWNLTDIDELYDLDSDPGEKVNLIREDALADILSELRKALYEELRAQGDPFVRGDWVTAQLLEGRKHARL